MGTPPNRLTGYLPSDYEGAHSLEPLSDDLTIMTAECPKCGVVRGARCVYLAPYERGGNSGQVSQDAAYHKHTERAGRATNRVHTERRQLARILISKRRKIEERKRAQARALKRPPAVQNRIELYAIKNQWEKDEQQQLVWWLARFASILLND